MKARIKETGEIKEIESIERFFCTPDGKAYRPHEIEIDFVDWEKRRWELVKAAMQGYISNEGREYMHPESLMKNTAEMCVKFADAVLAGYRKGGDE